MAAAPATAGIRIVLKHLLFARAALLPRSEARSGATLTKVAAPACSSRAASGEQQPGPVYNSAADAGWLYPQTVGHYAAYSVAALSPARRASTTPPACCWDAAQLLPAPAARQILPPPRAAGRRRSSSGLNAAWLAQVSTQKPFGLPRAPPFWTRAPSCSSSSPRRSAASTTAPRR